MIGTLLMAGAIALAGTQAASPSPSSSAAGQDVPGAGQASTGQTTPGQGSAGQSGTQSTTPGMTPSGDNTTYPRSPTQPGAQTGTGSPDHTATNPQGSATDSTGATEQKRKRRPR